MDPTMTIWIEEKTASTRQCSYNSQTFIPLQCKTESYKNSFFSRTIKDWDAYSNNEILEL